MDLTGIDFFSNLLTVSLLDLMLAGDNAIVIALVARKLPPELRTRVMVWGILGALVVRVALTALVVALLRIPGLTASGGVLLLPIAWGLMKHQETPTQTKASDHFWSALGTIILADVLMGVDNVLAIAGAAQGQLILVVLGLLLSMPLVIWGASLIGKMLDRFPIIVYVGAGATAFTGARMIARDQLLRDWFSAHPPLATVLEVLLVALVCGGGWLRNQRRRKPSSSS